MTGTLAAKINVSDAGRAEISLDFKCTQLEAAVACQAILDAILQQYETENRFTPLRSAVKKARKALDEITGRGDVAVLQ